MSFSMQSARAHLLSSNRAERSLVAAFGRSCPIHQRTRSLWDPAALFAGYVMLSFPFFISFMTNKAHINTKLWKYQTLGQDKLV